MSVTASVILDEYTRRTTRSRQLAEEARAVFPGGITHDARYFRANVPAA